jgi:hypothetical protein
LQIKEQASSWSLVPSILTAIHPLTLHDGNILQQGFGSLETIAQSGLEEIMQHTSLEPEKAEAIKNFFKEDYACLN